MASLTTTARRDGDAWILDGEKTLISNVPMAHHVVVFANADPAQGRKGIAAFVVEAGAPGVTFEPIRLGVPHPIGRVILRGARVPADACLGGVGRGLKLALETLDAFRIGVGAAANGMAARALELAVAHVKSRKQFGGPLADQQLVKAHLADMATELDAARLPRRARAAHLRDTSTGRMSVEPAMAKMFATERRAAHRRSVAPAARRRPRPHRWRRDRGVFYRDITLLLRIYEGATDIQKLVIAKGILG